jgi:hypothetical protein
LSAICILAAFASPVFFSAIKTILLYHNLCPLIGQFTEWLKCFKTPFILSCQKYNHL